MGNKVTIKLDRADVILAKRGFQKGGKAYVALLSELKRVSDPYVPMDTGMLKDTKVHVIIEKCQLVYDGPYARYLFYGKVMGPNFPIKKGGRLEGFYSPSKKKLTGRKLKYAGAPKRGSFWATRAWADHKGDILRNVAIVSGGKSV